MHKSLRWFIVFSRMPQFSDPEGRWFESSRAHQVRPRSSCCGALFVFPFDSAQFYIEACSSV